jgi:hypothetical protein
MALAAAALVGTAPAEAAAPADGVGSSDECHEHPPRAPYELHARSANLRSQPSPSAPVLGVLYPGHRIKATGERHGWVRVEDKTSGISGWASTRLIYRDAVMCLDGFVHENGQRFDSRSRGTRPLQPGRNVHGFRQHRAVLAGRSGPIESMSGRPRYCRSQACLWC